MFEQHALKATSTDTLWFVCHSHTSTYKTQGACWCVHTGTQAAAVLLNMDGYTEAPGHFDWEVLRVAVKELIVHVIMVLIETKKPPQEPFFKRWNLRIQNFLLLLDKKKPSGAISGLLIFLWLLSNCAISLKACQHKRKCTTPTNQQKNFLYKQSKRRTLPFTKTFKENLCSNLIWVTD